MGKDPIPVVCAIIESDGKFLAARRNASQTNAGLWEFPGGKVHDGESAEDALKREIQEELGASIEICERLSPSVYQYPWVSIRLIPFVCVLVKGSLQPHEHAEIRYVDRIEARQLDWAPADIPIMHEYLETKP